METKPSFKLAVKAILLDSRGRCLLLRRSAANRNFVGQWEWPGGKVDPGEDFAVAVVRETDEECGLKVALTGLGGATSFEMPVGQIIVLCLEVRQTGGEIHLSPEHDEFAWVPLAELGCWNLVDRVKAFMCDYASRKSSTQSPSHNS